MNNDTCAICGSENVNIAGHSWAEVTCDDCGYTGEPA